MHVTQLQKEVKRAQQKLEKLFPGYKCTVEVKIAAGRYHRHQEVMLYNVLLWKDDVILYSVYPMQPFSYSLAVDSMVKHIERGPEPEGVPF